MGVALIIVGILVFIVGGLAAMATLNNAIAFASAVLILVLGAVLFVGGAICDKLEDVRALLRKIAPPEKPPEHHV
jgi:uncharacterized membrane protein YiaA